MPLGQVSLKLGSGIRSSIVGFSSRGDILLSTALCYRLIPLPVRKKNHGIRFASSLKQLLG